MDWRIEKTSDKAFRLTFDSKGKIRFKSKVLVISDVHWDSLKCDREELKRVLDNCKRQSTPVFIIGDLFDCMGGKYDKRRSQKCIREEHKTDTYFDTIIDDAVKWFMPYKDIIALVTDGNHEDSIITNNETDLIGRFVKCLNLAGSTAQRGGYWGYVAIRQQCNKSNHSTKTLYFHHGFGGGGESSRGINQNMQTSRIAFADIYVSGHIHRRNMDDNIISCLDRNGNVIYKHQLFLRTSTFKQDLGGWASRMGMGPRPIGGWEIELEYIKDQDQKVRAHTT